MVKVDLITGFLGAGKTTFLHYYVKYLKSQNLKLCILENDYGAINIDMMLLRDLEDENCAIEMVSGGCDATCHQRRFKTKLIAMGMQKYDRVIIEPSGIFDIDEFFDTLYEEPLSNWYEIGNIFTIVDAHTNIRDNDMKYILASELACCGKALVSKLDYGCDLNLLKNNLNEALKYIGNNDKIDGRLYAKKWNEMTDEDFKCLMQSGYRSASYVKRPIRGFSSLFFMNNGFSLEELKKISRELFSNKNYGNVLRLKGFYLYDGSWYLINATRDEMTNEKLDLGQDVVIVIGSSLATDRINKLIDEYKLVK